QQPGTVIARQAAGISPTMLQRHLEAAFPLVNQIATERFVARNAERGVGFVSLAEARRHPMVKPMLQVMGAAVLALLLLVCANVASVLLARGHARRGEIGLRIALGASSNRVARQMLTESLVLSALAFPFAILLGSMSADWLASMRPALPQNWVLLR